MNSRDYKTKYQDLKLKFHDVADTSFRLGYEQGMQQAQMQQAQQQLQQVQAQAQQMQGQMGQEQGQPGAEQQEQGQEMPGQEQPDGSELDQHIQQLESMVQKSIGTNEYPALKKSLDGVIAFRNSLMATSEMKKAERAIKTIGKHMSKSTPHPQMKNLSEHGKRALTMQEQMVEDMMNEFAKEEAKTAEAINKVLAYEQLIKV